MPTVDFEIRHPDGRHERTSSSAHRVLIGSGAHCDVRLPADQAAFEHVAIERHPTAGRLVRGLAVAPAPGPVATVNGAPLTAVALGAGLLLRLGHTEIRVAPVMRAIAAGKGAGRAASLAKLAVLGALLGAIGVASRAGADPDAGPREAPGAPELFAAACAACPRADLAEARVVADEARARADGARERSPFDPREARSAVASYELAAACYRLVQSDAATDARESARRLREETALEFRARRVRLERLLRTGDHELASQDVTFLEALTDGQPSDYGQWLATVAQDLKNKQAEIAR
jgi:hypothetical protein